MKSRTDLPLGSAAGAVAGLPPQLLVRSEPRTPDLAQADWLIRHHAVTVLPSVFSLQTIALARGRAPAPEPLLAFADPVYDLDEGSALVASLDAASAGVLRGALAPLPETADEVRAVAAALGAPPAALRTGAAASEAGLKETRLSDFRVRITGGGVDASTRVIIDSADGQGRRWSTVGVSANIVDASFEALLDAIQWKLIRDIGRPQ